MTRLQGFALRKRWAVAPGALMVVCALSVTLFVTTPAAGGEDGSIVYIAEHDVWVTDPGGERRHRVTDDGTQAAPYSSPSQSADGTIVAIRNEAYSAGGHTHLRATVHVLDQDGQQIADPFAPAQSQAGDAGIVVAEGIPDAQVAPDGSLLAYEDASSCTNSFNELEPCPALRFVALDGTPVQPPYGTDLLSDPSWYSNTELLAVRDRDTIVALTPSTAPEAWLQEEPFNMRYVQPAYSRHGQILADVWVNRLGSGNLRVRAAADPPDGVPNACSYLVFGRRDRPGWSPQGTTLVWSEAAGVVTVTITPTDECSADDDFGEVHLIVPDGHAPHWSAAPLLATTTPVPTDPPTDEPGPPPVGGPFDGDPATTERVGAGDPTATAVAISHARYPDGAASAGAPGWVVLSRDDDFPDSLAGAPLTTRGPLLLTATDALTPATADEIARVLAPGGQIFLLGGTAAIGATVEADLQSRGYQVARLAGPTRVETAITVATLVRASGRHGDRVALARASGPPDNPTAGWADSVTGGAWSAREGVPILVTPTEELHPAVADALQRWGVTSTVLLGGTAALSPAVEAAVPQPQRWSGSERAETAAQIAVEGWGAATPGLRRFTIVNGFTAQGWAYGLPAAGLAFDGEAPLLVVNTGLVPDATAALVSSCDAPEVDLLVVGGTDQIGQDVVDALDLLDPRTC